MAAIESLDKDLVLIIIASTINSSVKELKDLTGQSTVELSLDAFLTKMNELIVDYSEAFSLTPIDAKVDKLALIELIRERKFADFVEVSGDILKIETNAKAFQAILSNIAVTSTLNYAKLLIKNIDDLGIIYRSSMDKTGAVESEEGEHDNALQDTTNIEKYTIEEEIGSGEVQKDTEINQEAMQEGEPEKAEEQDIEAEDVQEDDKIGLDVEADHDHNEQDVEDIEEHENELDQEQTENIELGEQGDSIEKEQAENEDENPNVPQDKQEEEEREEKQEEDEEKETEEKEEKEVEAKEEEEREEHEEGQKEQKEQEQKELEEQREQEEQKEQEEDQEKQDDQHEKEEEKLELNLEEKQDQQEDKDAKKDKGEQGNATPADSKNNVQTPEPKLLDGTKEELRSQSSRKRSRSLSVSTPQQHKRFQHIAVNLINNIQAHRFSSPFLQAVNTKEAPDYHEVIYEPKDLKNILKSIKLKNDPPEYQLIKQLKRDIMLMLANCIMYNKSDTDLVQLTKSMKNDVNNIFKLFEEAELDTK